MKKIFILANLLLCFTLTSLECRAKDEYYFYKITNTKSSVINANIEKTITNKGYKVIANDENGDFYFIPVQLTFWDLFWYGKSRVRYENYFIISTKQIGSDCYLTLSKNYIALRRKNIILNGIEDKKISLEKIKKDSPENKQMIIQVENFKKNIQLSHEKMVEEILEGKL